METRITITFLVLLISLTSLRSQDFQWVKHIKGGSGTINANDVALDGSGNIYIVGGYVGNPDFDPGTGTLNLGNASGTNIFFAKYSSTGSLIWAKALSSVNEEDIGYGIDLDNQSNVYITGKFATDNLDFDPGPGTAILNSGSGSGFTDMFLAKYNNNGNYLWAFNVGASGSGCGFDLDLDASNNVHVTGNFANGSGNTPVDFDPDPSATNNLDSGNGRIFYAKYNSSGDLIWAKNTGVGNGQDEGFGIAVDGSNNVYITGGFSGISDFDPDGVRTDLDSEDGGAFIAKYNSSGNYLWARQVSGQGGEFGKGIGTDGSNNVIVVGNTSLSSSSDGFLTKYNSSGTIQWGGAISLDNSGFFRAGKLTIDNSGNVYISGTFDSSTLNFNPLGTAVNLSATNSDLFLVKYNTSGIVQWARDVNASSSNFIEGTALASNSSDVVVTGVFRGTGDFNPCRGTANLTSTGPTEVFFGKYSQNSMLPTTINGPNAICATGNFTFSLNQVPPGATVLWTTSPSNILSPSSSTNTTFSTNATGSGTVTITANVDNTTACGNAVISKTSIRVGVLSTSEVTVTGTSMVCPGNVYYYNAVVAGGHKPGYTYSWSYPSNWTVPSGVTSSPQIGLQVPTYNPAYGAVSVNVTNECGPGPSPQDGITTYPGFGCGSYFTYYPNPADESLRLSSTAINQRAFEQMDTFEEQEEYQIELYDRLGNIVWSLETKAGEVDIPTSKLPNGIYLLKIYYLKETIEHSVMVKH